MKKIQRFASRVPRKLKYLLLFSFTNFIVSVIWPFIRTYAVAERGNKSYGGELFIWLLGFMTVYIADTIRLGRSKDETQEG